MACTSGRRLAAWSLTSVGVILLAAAAPVRAETIPVQVKVQVKTARGVETRVFRDIQGRFESDGSFSGAVELAGADWSTGAIVRGYVGPPRSPVVAIDVAPRGITPRGPGTGTVEATLGIALGFVAGAMSAEVAFSVCSTSHVVDNVVVVSPPISATDVVYGGSMAGGLIDGGGDGAATVSNNTGASPIYELRTTTLSCLGADESSVETLYDSPSAISVATSFGSANLPEASFGTPIPSFSGPDINGGLKLELRFKLTDFDMLAVSAVGHLEGTLPTGTAMGRSLVPRAASSGPAPSFTLVQRSQLPGLHYLRKVVGRATDGTFADSQNLPLGVPIGPLTLNGGVLVGSITDTFGGTCNLVDAADKPLYSALIDNATEFTLRDAPQLWSATGYRSTLIPGTSFGNPIPSAVGPQADTALDVRLDQELQNGCFSALAALYVVAQNGITPTSTSTPTPTPTNTATATITNTPTITRTPTSTNTPRVVPAIPTLSGSGVGLLLVLLVGAALVYVVKSRGQG